MTYFVPGAQSVHLQIKLAYNSIEMLEKHLKAPAYKGKADHTRKKLHDIVEIYNTACEALFDYKRRRKEAGLAPLTEETAKLDNRLNTLNDNITFCIRRQQATERKHRNERRNRNGQSPRPARRAAPVRTLRLFP